MGWPGANNSALRGRRSRHVSRASSLPHISAMTPWGKSCSASARLRHGTMIHAFVLGSLEEPLKLSAMGVTGFGIGARVTVARIAQDRVHIEADELLPVRRTEVVRVRIDADGRLIKPDKT